MTRKIHSSNRILFYTLISLIAITVYMIVNSYITQIKIFQEKELFKLDCIASSLTFNIKGEDHDYLFSKYPGQEYANSVAADSLYQALSMRMGMAKNMNDLNCEIYTMVFDSTSNNFVFGISSSDMPIWMDKWEKFPEEIFEKYETGGWISEPYMDENGTWLSAFSPITNEKGEVRALLQVDEKFDNFIMRARNQIYMNIGLSFIFISILGILMFFSLRSILKRQEKLRLEKLEVDKMRRELMANISHDLRTPLSSIYGYLQTIQMKKSSLSEEKINRYLNTSLKNTEKLKNLVDELFELSVLESKEKKIDLEDCNINELVFDVTNEFSLSAKNKGVTINTEIDESCPNVRADIALIDRALQNLIGNSVKFCGNGDIITVRTKHEKDVVLITVQDTGKGIKKSELENIFDRFTRATKSEIGTGLGLAIVKNILDLHNSKYKIESELNEGTTFRFCLSIVK